MLILKKTATKNSHAHHSNYIIRSPIHRLPERNLCRRIDVCDSLLKRHENDPFLKRIITGDEKGHGAKKMNRLKRFLKPIFTKKKEGVGKEATSELTKERGFSEGTLDTEIDDPGLQKEQGELWPSRDQPPVVHKRDA
ncbi:hypothetical protein TNCV_1021 [Trichonephila clavipes]|nr:hypothetical protein TNCV_1021 [Trichonephila clavipes]